MGDNMADNMADWDNRFNRGGGGGGQPSVTISERGS